MTIDLNYSAIPMELKERRQWVCIRVEERDGRMTKIPCTAESRGRRSASSTDPTTWSTFDEVVEAVARPGSGVDGIAFVLCEEDPYIFVDLDHVVEGEQVQPWAQKIIDRFASYTEFSLSRTGIHIIARGRKPGSRCRSSRSPQVEMYDARRLVVFTGDLFPGSRPEIAEAQQATEALYFELLADQRPSPDREREGRSAHSLSLSDLDLVEKASSGASGEKFRRLWKGETGGYGGDDSAADMALCCLLAFWTNGDTQRMDRLFRASGLMREKWDERRGDRTYGEMTIMNACALVAERCDRPKPLSGGDDRPAAAQEEDKRRIAEARCAGTAAAVFGVVDALARLPLGELCDTVRDLKGAIPSLDLRELKKAIKQSRTSPCTPEKRDRPILVVNDRQLREMGDEAMELLHRSNVPPTLFVRSGNLCEVLEDERGHSVIRAVTHDVILTRLARVCDIVSATPTGFRNVLPPRALAEYVLSQPSLPFPALEAITRFPSVRPDGTLALSPGYDASTKLFYHPTSAGGLEVPEAPSDDDVNAARGFLDELLQDFPFDTEASRTNTVALLLSPVLLPAINDITPLFLIDAPTAGSGKSLLATVIGVVSTGSPPDFTTAPLSEEEWSKKITATLFGGPPLVVFDNVNHTLKSPALAAVLTTRVWKDRVFGRNTETVALPNRAVWVATGNNIQLGGDISRRCVWIRLDPRVSRPHERTGFSHPNLVRWATENRRRLLWALLVLCRRWFAAGRPSAPLPPFGSFETWTSVVGNVLVQAGLKGFLDNRDELGEQSDTESGEWESFLSRWQECYGASPITPKALIHDMEAGEPIAESAPTVLGDILSSKGDRCSRLGRQLTLRRGKRYGPRGLRLERAPRSSKGTQWFVISDGEASQCRDESAPCTDSTPFLSSEWRPSAGCEGLQAPDAGELSYPSQQGGDRCSEGETGERNPAQPCTLHLWVPDNYEEF